MPIPIAYNLRNLVVRKTTTVLTALGIALTVAVLVADVALLRGLRSVFERSGDPQRILVLRKGSGSELTSAITREAYRDLLFTPGIASSQSGAPMASLEMVTVVNLPRIDNAKNMNVSVRGLTPRGIEMRKVRIDQGRWFEAGQREIVVGKSIAGRHPNAKLGKTFRFGKGEWQVVGIMDGGESALDNEIWGDLNQVSSDFNRPDRLSSVLIRADDVAAVPALINSVNDDRRLNASAITERAYYDSQTAAGAPIQFLGILVTAIMAVGSGFAAMNTMYAAVYRRASEIGTLRALGFSRVHILISFLIESLLLSLAGGLLGCLIAFPLNYFGASVGNLATFSEITFWFRVDSAAMFAGIAFALLMGAIGGFFPAINAARKEALTALREI